MINLKPRMDGSVDVRDGRAVIARILPCNGAILIAVGDHPQPGPTIVGAGNDFSLTIQFTPPAPEPPA